MSADATTRTVTKRLCAALCVAIELNVAEGNDVDPRTLDGLVRLERWVAGADVDIDALVEAMDAVAEEYFEEACGPESDGCFHPRYQTANTVWQVADLAAHWSPEDESSGWRGAPRLAHALEFLAGLVTCNGTVNNMPLVAAPLGIVQPPDDDEFDRNAVLASAREVAS